MSWPPLPGDGWYLLNVIGQADVSWGAGPSIWGQGGGSAGPHAGQRSAHWELSLPECLGCKCVSCTGVPLCSVHREAHGSGRAEHGLVCVRR